MHKHASSNRFYRLVWSHVHSCWVAVAEGARGRGKSAARKLATALLTGALSGAALAAGPGAVGMAPPPALNALPTGAQVVAGQASVSSAGNRMTVQQGSDKAILNWQSFDIGAGAGVRFVQPGAQSVALNRVLGNDPSRIYGQLSANGKVFLVNQSGVMFGAGARVDVGGLVASSLNLPDGDFLAGRYTFSGNANAGAVRNEGSIRTADGGVVALIGPVVGNSGSIVAPNGAVALGAGEQVAVDLRGDGLIVLRVERGAVDALVENSGVLQADGGRVELSARGVDALARASVNNTGLVQARGLVADGGSIRLVGDGAVQAGALDASSVNGKGGQIAVEGRFVALDKALDAGGRDGGGVTVDAGATLSAAASTSALGRGGDGGTIAYRSGGDVIESVTASTDAGGARDGGSVTVHGAGGVLSSASHGARGAAGQGGQIDVSGLDVRLLSATLDASGATQGGLVRVGGAFQGGAVRPDAPDLARFVTRWGETAPIATASQTFIGDGSTIRVDASGAQGQGGTAVVWSNDQTTMLGAIDARGAGAAGTVEISSKDTLRHVGLERIALGAGGQLLLDPKNITIGAVDPNVSGQWTYQAILGKGYGVTLGNGAGFGFGVALNASGDRMAVGAPGDAGFDGSAEATGAVRLFSFGDGNFSSPVLQGTIGNGYSGGKNLNMGLVSGDAFGTAVALNADATALAVGAPGEFGFGSVYMINFMDTTFSAPIISGAVGRGYSDPGLENSSSFGASVALNAAGNRLAVGSLNDFGASGSCNACGAVYLYNNANTSPTLAKTIGAGYNHNQALAEASQFGTAVAFDASGDRLAVGAVGASDSGAVYLYNNVFGATNTAQIIGNFGGASNILNPGLNAGDFFGSGVAFNSAGTRLAIGASGAGPDRAGNVSIIDFSDNQFGTPVIGARLGTGYTGERDANVTLQDGENFGFSLAMNGAGNRLVVGSPFHNGSVDDASGSGVVRAFSLLPHPISSLPYSNAPDASVTVDAVKLAAALDAGTSVTLQANNDITLQANNPITVGDTSGNGVLRLQAGRSIVLNANITTGNANLFLTANDTVANGVVNAYRDAGAAVISTAGGTAINAGSGALTMTLADGAGKTNSTSGAITIDGTLAAGSMSLRNLGTSAGSNVVINGAVTGTANGLIEIATTNALSTFQNNAGAAGLNPGAGRYLVYANNPGSTLEGVTGYQKHYAQAFTGVTPGYAASGNWFLYSVTPTLNVSATPSSKVYDGVASAPPQAYGAGGFIDGDTIDVLYGALGVTGLSKNVGTYAYNLGSLATDLGYAINFTSANLSVTARTLNATVTGVNKTYDGNAVASVTYGDNRIAGDQLNFSGSASFADKAAAAGKTVSVTGITLGGQDAANYTLASNSGATSATISQRVLNASASAQGKVYDGQLAAAVTLDDNRVEGDVLALSFDNASFADKNVGVGKSVTVSGIAVNGVDADNYTLAAGSVGASATITQRSLAASAVGQDKIYDGALGATVAYTDNRVSGDLLSVSGNAAFADKTAGGNKAIGVSGIALAGSDADNYVLAATTASTSATILQRVLNISASGVDKTYDGNADATLTFGDNRVTGDVLAYGASASFDDKNAGIGKTVTVGPIALGGLDAANYVLAPVPGTTVASIAQRTLVVGATGIDKVYDGAAGATVTLSDNRIDGDVLNLSGSAGFADKNVGDGKTVTVSAIALDGLDAANYVLAADSATTGASITARTLNADVAVQDKVYDGGLAAQFTLDDNRVAGDVLTIQAALASFADKNVGNAKAVTVSGLSLSGADAGNYVLDANLVSSTAAITPRALNVSASGIGKVYDGLLDASVILGDDRVNGDQLSATGGAAAFVDKNAGAAKAISVGGLALAGEDAANYMLASNSVGATADIARRALSASATGVNKTYDGGVAAAVTFGDDRIAGDVLSYTANAAFADKAAGAGKTIAVTEIALAGQDADNYTLESSTAGASADILQRTLTANATGIGKTYDGNRSAGVVLTDDRVDGDELTLSAANARFADKNAGNDKAIAVDGITLAGADAANYTLAATDATAQATIARRQLNVTASGADKVYDGATDASVALADDRLEGDVFALAGSASFADKNVGSAKAIGVTAITLDGLDAANYALAPAAVGASASITRRTLAATVAAQDKVYDGTVDAQFRMSDNRVAGDLLELAASASFADRNAGSGKTVTVSGLTLAGADAANYLLAADVASSTASITPRALTVSGMRANAKVFDGATGATVANAGALDGLVAGESLVLNGPTSVRFATRGAGTGKLVTASGYGIADGAGGLAGNYTLLDGAVSNEGAITQAILTVKADDAVRAAGSANPAFGYSVSGLVGGDSTAILPAFVTASSATPASASGTYAITVGASAALNDYRFAFVDGVLTVNPAPVLARPDVLRVIASAIRPIVPNELAMASFDSTVGGNGATGDSMAERRDGLPRAQPRLEPVSGSAAPTTALPIDGSIITLAGGTQVVTRAGGVRTAD